MNKPFNTIFIFFIICFCHSKPERTINDPSTDTVIAGTLEVKGITNVYGTILCLTNVNTKDLVSSNVNCFFNTTPSITDTDLSINFGSADTTNSIILKGLLERNDFSNFLVIDQSGKIFQKNIELSAKENTIVSPTIIDTIEKLYLQLMTNYTNPTLNIIPKDTDLIINAMNTNSIELIGHNILLNFQNIDTSHDAINFLVPMINTNNQINTTTLYIEQSNTINSLVGSTMNTIISFGDFNLNSSIRIFGSVSIDGNQISLTAANPIIFPSNTIKLYGVSDATSFSNIDSFLGLDENHNLTKVSNPELLFEYSNSPDGQTLTIKQDPNFTTDTVSLIFENNNEQGITISGKTLYLNGKIMTANQEPIIFKSKVFFFNPLL